MTTNAGDRLEYIEESLARYDARLARLEELETALDEKDRQIAVLQATRNEPSPTSRRNLFRGGALAAGAAIAGSLATPTRAAAANGDGLIIGERNTASAETLLEAAPSSLPAGSNIFTVSDNSGGSFYPSAIGGYAYGDKITNGVYAYTNTRVDDRAATGHALVAFRDAGGRSNIWMRGRGDAPLLDTHEHGRGECIVDSAGTLWFCVEEGTPGTWRKVAGQTTAGAVHAIAPARVADTRFDNDPIAGGAARTISIADSIDPVTADVAIADVVPEGATAVFFNLTITRTTGGGFLSVAPGGTTTPAASTINWASSGVTIANGSMSTLDDARQLAVLAGGTGTTHFIVDVTGYTL